MKTFKQHIEESLRKPDSLLAIRKANDSRSMAAMGNGEWTELGSGAHGSVYSRAKDHFVVKFFNYHDTGYRYWLLFSLANQNNSFVPKIIGRPVPVNTQLSVVRIERLFTGSNVQLMHLMDWWMKYRRLVRVKARKEEFEEVNALWRWSQKREDFIKVMSYLDNHSFSDIRGDNFMVRSNGQMVLSDPLAMSHEKRTSKYAHQINDFLHSRFDADKRKRSPDDGMSFFGSEIS